MDVALSSSAFAGAAAQQEDTQGLPSYAQFKKHATFRTDLTDFGVDIRQLNRLLAECNYGIAVGGMGLGDLHILFNSIAKRMGVLTYDGVLRLCRLIRPRLVKVEAAIASEEYEDGAGGMGGVRAATGVSNAWAAPASTSQARGGGGPLRPSSAVRRAIQRAESGADYPEAAREANGNGGSDNNATNHQQQQLPGRMVSFKQSEREGDTGTSASGPPGPSLHVRPASASRLLVPASSGADAGPSTSGRSVLPDGLNGLMTLKDPPVLLREHLSPPHCSFPAIAARIAGIQVLYRDGEMTRVALSLRDVQRDWEAAILAGGLSQAIRRPTGHPAPGSSAAEAALMARGEIPSEGRLWLLLMDACCRMMEGRHASARKRLVAAEKIFGDSSLGVDHPYHYCIHLFFGLLGYYEQKYEEAIAKFDSARELAELVCRRAFNLTARRNAAACLNNKGVCHSLLGNRSEAVTAFRAAHQMLRPSGGVPDVPEAVVTQRNLNKALKQGFAVNTSRLRPVSAPPLYSNVGSTLPQKQKLLAFLQSAITIKAPEPVITTPAWCVKVTADDIIARKKAKEAEKKAKAKAKERGKKPDKKLAKAPAFEAMDTYPFASYGVANVKLAVKKGKKKKKA
ncbi:hypothetical protein Agub_g6506, partial [Astrephomene gubernaculifera]